MKFEEGLMRDFIYVFKMVAYLIIIISLIVLIVGIKIYSSEKLAWNNGICSECGGNYVFVEPIGHENYTSYFYKCDRCGKGIDISKKFPDRSNN